jgi:dipeptidyl aminopeptidase/acylaminoacyl peptidase
MAEQLKASGDTTEVLVVPDGGRLFNFRQPQQATHAWQATLAWLDRYLHPTPRAGR